MNKPEAIDNSLIRSWIDARFGIEAVEEELKTKGFSEEGTAAHLKEFKKERYASRRMNGFICAGLGALLGFISCLLTIINPIPELYNLILFGLTSVAILLICLGLYFLFE